MSKQSVPDGFDSRDSVVIVVDQPLEQFKGPLPPTVQAHLEAERRKIAEYGLPPVDPSPIADFEN